MKSGFGTQGRSAGRGKQVLPPALWLSYFLKRTARSRKTLENDNFCGIVGMKLL